MFKSLFTTTALLLTTLSACSDKPSSANAIQIDPHTSVLKTKNFNHVTIEDSHYINENGKHLYILKAENASKDKNLKIVFANNNDNILTRAEINRASLEEFDYDNKTVTRYEFESANKQRKTSDKFWVKDYNLKKYKTTGRQPSPKTTHIKTPQGQDAVYKKIVGLAFKIQ